MEVRARPELLSAVILGGFALLILIAVAIAMLLPATGTKPASSSSIPLAPALRTSGVELPHVVPKDMTQALVDPAQLRPISPTDAIAFNASIPLSTEPNSPARPFTLVRIDPQDVARAQDCLAAAVYYEAASEPEAGQRAVAQAVLNRVRHFAYPKTVCGVVFQGSDRETGCQFTFTCDGSMTKAILPDVWTRSRKIAVDALDGHVEKSVGYATHYHADYVAPYWQPTLLKVAVIGRHIFYRGADGWGRPAAFAGRYAGGEPEIPALAAALMVVEPPPPPIDAIDAPPSPLSNADTAVPAILAPPPPILPTKSPVTAAPAAPATAPGPVQPAPQRMVVPREPRQRRLPM
jgi:spore germination cell wall hydrolase CwlJ-like protein